MRTARLGAAVLAVALLIPYCARLQRAGDVKPPPSIASAPAPARGDRPAPPGAAPATDHAASAPAAGAMLPRATASPSAATPSTAADDEVVASSLATLPPPESSAWGRGRFADFSPEELADMAARCELRWQLPPFAAAAPSIHEAAYDRALAVERQRYAGELRALYVEATGDSDGAAHLGLGALGDAIRRETDDDAIATHRRLAQARAGDPIAPTGSVYERYLRLQLDAGDAFERTLAADVGAARAHELRLAAGSKHTLTGCDPARALYRSSR